MKKEIYKLFYKIGVLSGIILSSLLIYDFNNPFREYEFNFDYAASVIDKQAYCSSLKSPKVIAMGGSSIAYGLDSKLLADSLKIPVANLAQQYSLGSYFMLQQAAYNAKPSDIILLSFEYMVSHQGSAYEKSSVAYYFPEATQWISSSKKEILIQKGQFFISHLRNNINRHFAPNLPNMTINDTIYVSFRKAFNKEGDLISHFNNPIVKNIDLAILNDKSSMLEVIKDINEFDEEMKKKQIKVLFSFSPINKSSYRKNKQIIEKIEAEFKNNAKFTLLNSSQSMVFDDSLFQDMAYHLNPEGRKIRSEMLLQQIKQAIKK